MHRFPLSFFFLSLFLLLFWTGRALANQHPEVLVKDADRAAIQAKIKDSPWARQAFQKLKDEIDQYVALSKADPHFVSSRLFMNWSTHYTLPITEHERWISGRGYAPVPTPRFAGARDWASPYTMPHNLADYQPYNDQNGKVWMIDSKTHHGGWIDPGQTGRTMELVNERIETLAADAGFLYWLTGDERYAKFGTDILWTYLVGFSYVQPPQFPSQDLNTAKIIGSTSFEVIHENIMIPLSVAYDFLHDDLIKDGKDVGMIQLQLKRMADRVVAGGFKEGNWNLNEQMMIAYAGLALEDNAVYADGRGRQYYVDLVLNADTPTKLGLTKAIRHGYDQTTALWPEAPGYGFGGTELIVEIASLLQSDSSGSALLNDPFLTRAILAQDELIYPNGWSVGVGDTDNTRLNTKALELLIAAACQQGNAATEDKLTAALQREIDNHYYRRADQGNLLALTHYVGELKPVAPPPQDADRTYFASPLNIVMQRNLSDPTHSLAAAMYGTEGGHVHANGLALELYGAGLIMGADPGRGASYWQKENGEYYSQPPAHNTVIVNGQSNYSAYGPGHVALTPDAVEPAFGQAGVDPNLSFVEASFRYATPAAEQQRTLALIRTGPTTGFYFDVFRSRADVEAGSFHDYLYHDIGQSLVVNDGHGQPLALAPSHLLEPQPGKLLVGYGYFKDEKSIDSSSDLSATFTVNLPDHIQHHMALWLAGQQGRQIFSVSAPADHAGLPALPTGMSDLPMPTLLARQKGEAWHRPFMAIYEPYLGAEGPLLHDIRAIADTPEQDGLAACVAQGPNHSTYYLLQSDHPETLQHVEGCSFQGIFGMAARRAGSAFDLYLGRGTYFSAPGMSIISASATPLSASLRREGDHWSYSASAPARVTITLGVQISSSPHFSLTDANHAKTSLQGQLSRATATTGQQTYTCLIPAGLNQTLSQEK